MLVIKPQKGGSCKIKKSLSYVAVLFLVLIFAGTQFSCARTQDEPALQVERGVYRADFVDYIQKNWKKFFSENELAAYGESSIVVGEPFGIYSLDAGKMCTTKFPVYVDGHCVQVLDVFELEDGQLSWSASISEDFLQEIDELKHKKGRYRFESKEDPNGGAPSLDIVRLPDQDSRPQKDRYYSDINKPLLVLESGKSSK